MALVGPERLLMMKSAFSMMMSTWLATLPLFAHAQSAPETVPYDKPVGRPSRDSAQIVKKTDNRGYVEVVARDQNGKESVFQLRKTEDPEIRKFSPKALSREFAENLKKMQPYEAVKATTKRFPMESGLFFMAIGAVTAMQIFSDYSSNPMRMQQHIEHSLSPMGMFSFYMFMSTNGVTSNALSTIIKNPKYHGMIPYLGMTAGYFVQSTIATFAADPNVKACAKAMLGHDISQMPDVAKDPCDAAFSYYALKGKFYDLTPGLISMLGSSFIAFQAQNLAVQLLRFASIDIAFLFIPGGVGVISVRFLIVSAIQMGLFYYIDVVWLNHFVTSSFKNIFDGSYISRLDRELTNHLIRKKQTRWADQLPTEICQMQKKPEFCERDFAANLKHMQEQLGNWRMFNLSKIYEAHMTWQEMLARMNSQYDATYSFYKDLVDEIRNSKWKLTSPLRLELVDPLYGVKANGLPDDKAYMYYLKPHFTENQASETAMMVGQSIQKQLDDGSYVAQGFAPYDLRVLKEAAQKLSSNDPIVQGQGVGTINKALDRVNMDAFAYTVQMIDELRRITSELGEGARPLMKPGQGFFARYERWSEAAESLKTVKFPQISASFRAPKATDYMAVQAVCGPDANEKDTSLTPVTFGGSASFTPPRIVSQQPTNFVCEGLGDLTADMIFSYPFQSGKNTQEGLVGFLKENVRPEILGDRDNSGFIPWWEANVENKIKAKYEDFGRDYETIIKKLIAQLHTTADSKLNMGPAPNGIVPSIRQQLRLDLMVLGELLKDHYQMQHQQALPIQYFSSKPEPVPGVISSGVRYLKTVPRSTLLRSLKEGSNAPGVFGGQPTQTSILEFDRLAPLFYPELATPSLATARGHALQIQKELEYEFETLLWMLRRIKVAQVDGEERISSNLENSELEEKVQKITEKTEAFGKLLGVGEAEDGAIVKLPTQEIRDVAINALEDILALANEVHMYGSIANAVSWEKIRNVKAAGQQQREFNSKVQKQVQQLRGSMARIGGAH